LTSVVSVSLAVDGAGLGATLCGGTRSKVVGSVLAVASVGRVESCVFQSRRRRRDHVEVTNMGGGIDGRISPPHK
jgi:hypothetical protein